MAILNERKDAYGHKDGEQADKSASLCIAKTFAGKIQALLAPYLKECESYEPGADLRIKGAPAVRLPSGKLVIAPDLRCVTHSGRVFWVEAKDKSQRFFFPDTGADLHQVLGWYQINDELKEPVLLVFQDPPYPQGVAKDAGDWQKDNYKSRWDAFKGEPYGNWLANCLSVKDSYPQLFAERTRNTPIYILYFHVNTMKHLGDWGAVVKAAERDQKLPKLAVFKKFGIDELTPMAIGGSPYCTAAETQGYLDLVRQIIGLVDAHAETLPMASSVPEPVSFPAIVEDVTSSASGLSLNDEWALAEFSDPKWSDAKDLLAAQPTGWRLVRALLRRSKHESIINTLKVSQAQLDEALQFIARKGWQSATEHATICTN